MEINIHKYPVIRIEKDSICDGIKFGYYREQLPDKVLLCPWSEVSKYINNKILPAHAAVGETYLASPYDKTYISIHKYEENIISKKAHHVSVIANLLGASDCEYNITLVSIETRNLSGKLKAMSNEISTKIDANITSEIENKYRSAISVKAKDKGSIPTAKAYERALKYATEHNMLEEESVRQLLDTRNPNSHDTNWRQQCDIKVHLCQEINDNLDVAASIGVMGDVFNFDSNFVRAILQKKELILDISYTFPIPD